MKNWYYLTVDSGQLFITDPGYLDSWRPGDYTEGVEPNNSYARVTAFMSKHDGYGEVENGIVVGVEGDGYYPVYVIEDDYGHLIKPEVVFQSDCNEYAAE